MKISVWSQDVTQQVAAQVPVTVLWRPLGKRDNHKPWHILQEPLASNRDHLRWSTDRRSEQIRVPMFPYRLIDVEMDVLFRFGAQFSAAVIGMLPIENRPEELVIVHSKIHPRDDGQAGYQLWVGVAAMFTGS